MPAIIPAFIPKNGDHPQDPVERGLARDRDGSQESFKNYYVGLILTMKMPLRSARLATRAEDPARMVEERGLAHDETVASSRNMGTTPKTQ